MSDKKQNYKDSDKVSNSKKEYMKPSIDSQLYQERGALGCNKMNGQNPSCNANSDVS